ncbi:MAG: hypothetical protein QM736_22690 [Vicinamibacterales bacterium]
MSRRSLCFTGKHSGKPPMRANSSVSARVIASPGALDEIGVGDGQRLLVARERPVAEQDREIEPTALHPRVELGRRLGDLQVDAGKLLARAPEQRGCQRMRGRRQHPDAHGARDAPGARADVGGERIRRGEPGAHARQDLPAGVRQRHAATRAMEQRRAAFALELCDLPADA